MKKNIIMNKIADYLDRFFKQETKSPGERPEDMKKLRKEESSEKVRMK